MKVSKSIKTLAAALTAVVVMGMLTPIRASDSDLQFGVRAGANLNQFSWGGVGLSWTILDPVYGFDAGLTAKYPLTNWLTLNAELNFCYRFLYNVGADDNYYWVDDYTVIDVDEGYYRYSESEMALLVPVMAQFRLDVPIPLYLSAGIQLGFPFNNTSKYEYKFSLDGEVLDEYYAKDKDDGFRSLVDFGAAFGIGYMATKPKLGVELRYVININDVYDRKMEKGEPRHQLMCLTLGVSYFI
jgi:hypothetical protein